MVDILTLDWTATLHVEGNILTGPLPNEFLNFTTLRDFSAGGNFFSLGDNGLEFLLSMKWLGRRFASE